MTSYRVLVFGRGFLAEIITNLPATTPCGVQSVWEAEHLLRDISAWTLNYNDFALYVLAEMPQGTQVKRMDITKLQASDNAFVLGTGMVPYHSMGVVEDE